MPFDIHVTDTYFVVSHLHFVLFGGSVFAIYAGVYHWFPKMTGRMMNERWGKIHFWLTLIIVLLHLLPDAHTGDAGDAAPRVRLRRGLRRCELRHLDRVLRARCLVRDLRLQHDRELGRGPVAESNPWRANTLEWQVSSPPPIFNFDEIPQVVGGPYEYGVPGARHAILRPTREAQEVPA